MVGPKLDNVCNIKVPFFSCIDNVMYMFHEKECNDLNYMKMQEIQIIMMYHN